MYAINVDRRQDPKMVLPFYLNAYILYRPFLHKSADYCHQSLTTKGPQLNKGAVNSKTNQL